MKRRLHLALLYFLLFAGCGAHIAEPVLEPTYRLEPAHSAEELSAPSSVESSASVPETIPPVEDTSPELRRISREESGLDLIPHLSLDGLEIHPTVLEAYEHHLHMDYPEFFPDVYYQQGLEAPINHYDGALIISNRWEDFIIADVSIGSTRDDLIALLGEPVEIRETDTTWRYYYKTKQYYLLFEGDLSTDKIQCALLSPAFPLPEQYNDAIEQIVRIFKKNQDDVYNTFQELGEYSFFDGFEIRNGGVFGADSPYGVSIFGMDAAVIIYNNFEGDLYQVEGKYNWPKIEYDNYDPNISSITGALDNYHNTHDPDYYEDISHDGRYYIRHEFVYSQAQYIWVYDSTLRRNPYRVWARRVDSGGGYGWLDDTYTIFCYEGTFDEMLLIDISDELPHQYFADDELKRDIFSRYDLVGTR